MSRRPNIHPYLPPELHKRFKNYVASKGVTESSVVEAALKEHLDGTSDFTLLIRRLDRIGRRIDRVQRDVDVLGDAFAAFVQIWFAHNPKIDDDQKDAAERQALRRYQKFVDFVAEQVSGGKRFVDDLVKDPLADPQELAAAAKRDEASE